MATVAKDFKVKNGLVVEGSTATVAGNDVLTKSTDDQNYIIGLIGGSATSDATPDTVVLRDENGSFSAVEITADLIGDVTGQVSDISNHSTSDLTEGTNKYFTDQRAIDAQAGLWDAAGSAADAQDAAESYADGLISTEVTNRNSAIATAKSEAISTASDDATSKANTAESNANDYTDSAISTEVTNRNNAIDDAISAEVTDRNNAIDSAITNLNLAGTYDALGAADAALSDANAYTDQKVADLVDSAPEMLDTLNELAAAIADNPNYATDVANLVATKADTTYVDSEISDLDSAAQGYATTAENNAKGYADSLASNYDAAGAADAAYGNAVSYTDQEISALDSSAQDYADTAEQNAKNYADGLAINYDAAGAATTAENNAKSYTDAEIGALTTDDIEEGVNSLYYTDSRARDVVVDALTNANKSNIQITANVAGVLTITAENGVADSTTDDLEEGSSNLYFTDERAVSALEAVTPNFVEVDLNSVATQVASSTGLVATASTVTAYAFPKADYRSAKFFVKTAYGTHTEVSEVILTLDTSDNIAITEYATVGTNGSSMSISADVSGTDVRLRVTTVNNNSTVTVVGTLLA
jgi:hypothetical protein